MGSPERAAPWLYLRPSLRSPRNPTDRGVPATAQVYGWWGVTCGVTWGRLWCHLSCQWDRVTQCQVLSQNGHAPYMTHVLSLWIMGGMETSNGPCLIWWGATNSHGYGYFYARDTKSHEAVHRRAYENAYGPIPDGMVVMHTCDTPACFAAEHLVLGTQSENIKQSVARGRHANGAKTHCPHGHEYTLENTYAYRGRRNCRACWNASRRT